MKNPTARAIALDPSELSRTLTGCIACVNGLRRVVSVKVEELNEISRLADSSAKRNKLQLRVWRLGQLCRDLVEIEKRLEDI
jgi:hypothetical protein